MTIEAYFSAKFTISIIFPNKRIAVVKKNLLRDDSTFEIKQVITEAIRDVQIAYEKMERMEKIKAERRARLNSTFISKDALEANKMTL